MVEGSRFFSIFDFLGAGLLWLVLCPAVTVGTLALPKALPGDAESSLLVVFFSLESSVFCNILTYILFIVNTRCE